MTDRTKGSSQEPHIPDESLDIDLAIDLAHAIQRFRNEPLLGEVDHKLRATPGFVALCRAWEAFTERYPHALLKDPRNYHKGDNLIVKNMFLK